MKFSYIFVLTAYLVEIVDEGGENAIDDRVTVEFNEIPSINHSRFLGNSSNTNDPVSSGKMFSSVS